MKDNTILQRHQDHEFSFQSKIKAKMVCVKLQIIEKDTLNIVHINACGRANFGCQLIEITVIALFPIFQLFKLFSVNFNRWYIASDSWIYCYKLKAIFIANASMHCIEWIFHTKRRRRRKELNKNDWKNGSIYVESRANLHPAKIKYSYENGWDCHASQPTNPRIDPLNFMK